MTKMIRKALLIVLLGVCSGYVFEPSLKFSSWRKGIHRFAQKAANFAKTSPNFETTDDGTGSQRNLLDKLRAALLIKGQPLDGFSPNALLPLFGLKKSSSQQRSKASSVTVQSYSIANCSEQAADKAIFLIENLTVSPDPLSMPGDLTFAFKIKVKQDIDNISVAVDFRKKMGSAYIKVPCIGEFGSCTYPVCDMLQQVASCPEELQKNKIPCYCPFRKGQYKEPGITAQIDSNVFPSGDYKATANMTAGKVGFIGCYEIKFSVVNQTK